MVTDALRFFRDHDEEKRIRLEQLKQEIRLGIEQLDRGESDVLDDQIIEGIKRRGREKLASGRNNGSGGCDRCHLVLPT